MATVTKESLPKNVAKLTITVSSEDMKPFLDDAAHHLSEHMQIPGFRPGKADFETVKRHAGEMKIYEEALEPIVRKTFLEAILSEKLETVGSPAIDVVKLAPGNDLVYTATVNLMPKVEQLANFRTLEIKGRPVTISEENVSHILQDLQRMQTREIRAAAGEAATNKNKIVVDMNIKKDGVPIEGGQAVGHHVYLNEHYFIPGFVDQVVGLKEGEQKTFTLKFPDEHFQKQLAGAPVEFEVTMKELYHLEHPTLDDAFAVSLGQKDFAGLKERLSENMKAEKEEQEQARVEREMLELIAGKSRFDDIPDLLVNEEINKMIEELKRGVAEQGMEFEAYLKSIKKTLADLKLDMSPQAILRVKVALVMREIAKTEDVKVAAEELDAEIDRQAALYEDKEKREQVYAPEYRDYVETILKNRKVIDLLGSIMVK